VLSLKLEQFSSSVINDANVFYYVFFRVFCFTLKRCFDILLFVNQCF